MSTGLRLLDRATPRESLRIWPAAGFLVLVAAALRLWSLGSLSLWVDEGFTYYVSGKPVLELAAFTAAEENHPPLYYVFMHFWTLLAGNNEYSLRLLSAWTGIAAVALTMVLGRRLAGRGAGFAAALLLLVSPLHVWLSQEARMYAPLTALAIASFTLFAWAWQRPTRTAWIAYGLVAVAVLFTHYYGVLLLLAQAAAGLLLAMRERRWRWGWPLAQLGATLCFLPWLAIVWRQQWTQSTSGLSSNEGFLATTWRLVEAFGAGEGPNPLSGIGPLVGGLLLALALAGLWELRHRPAVLILLVSWLAVPLLLPYLAQTLIGGYWRFGGPRYALVLLPAFLVLVGAGAAAPRWRALRLSGLAVALALSGAALYAQQSTAQKEDFRSAAQYIAAREGDDETIVLNAEHIYPAFSYYYHGSLEWHRAASGEAPQVISALKEATAGRRRVWLVLSHEWVSDPQGRVEAWFEGNGLKIDEQWLPGVHLFQYLMEPRPNYQPPPIAVSLEASFDEGLKLLGHAVPGEVEAGAALRIPIVWQSVRPVDEDYQAVFSLVDGRGRVVAQTDRRPIAWQYGTSHWQPGEFLSDLGRLPIPLGIAPGEYTLYVSMYTPSSKKTLSATGPQARDNRVLLTSVEVRRPATPPKSLPPEWTQHAVDLNGDLRLLYATVGGESVWAGQGLPVTLVWQARRAVELDYQPAIEVVGDDGSLIASQQGSPVDGTYPTSRWAAGEVVREERDVQMPARAPVGHAAVVLALDDGTRRTIGEVTLRAPNRRFDMPATARRVDVQFGGMLSLAGYELSPGPTRPGAPLSLVLYWQARGPIEQSYTVFAHVLDAADRVVAQVDSLPASGQRPTTGWVVGEVVRDERQLVISADAVPSNGGPLRIEVGMYLAATGERLPVNGDGNRVLLDEVVEVQPQQ
ncbi:MAG: glycosyltransferase family 39 protein [Bacteroidetes bacterium]|nr:glycosyltransferase family 39 protein [Bacteroidota bacterium]